LQRHGRRRLYKISLGPQLRIGANSRTESTGVSVTRARCF
jgi:hypothetical protein